ncbi:IS3 family transposase [Streptomyces sp. NPDC101455]|uniref:IS3 family transposase n=1 Tax=Streptomyces sp. NPDC101455 TaxID=3366142 RepID=UPI0038149757
MPCAGSAPLHLLRAPGVATGPGVAGEGRRAAGGRDPGAARRLTRRLRGSADPRGPARAGRIVNGKRVERLMRVHHITGITRRRRRGLTRQARRAVFAADLIGRDFTPPRPGMRLVGDMTELITLEGKLYLATCIDLATREVVGWAMADHHRAALPVAALRMAAGRGGLEDDCIMHTDRGSEYTSDEFRTEIGKLRMRQSMGRVGSCYDNAAAESWFAVLKAEIGATAWATREAARADVFHYIEVEYNRSRLRRHPEYGYVTPLETRTLLRQDHTPAA